MNSRKCGDLGRYIIKRGRWLVRNNGKTGDNQRRGNPYKKTYTFSTVDLMWQTTIPNTENIFRINNLKRGRGELITKGLFDNLHKNKELFMLQRAKKLYIVKNKLTEQYR